ncbi:serine/threonine-protein kinase [Streptomyces sp. NBC_01198]|uniref:serine/threonine-protein kinase n=1 Tax=Streptomyces sp. NBC_01198 TaxID=2903769 RepID=UPI002E111A63|nr:serine/threonine protein kinase [Streptomyces sp. NBC_01198]
MESLGAGDPRSIGGYPLFARLGAGGMGQVFLARTPAGRALALKTVRPEFALDPGFGDRFAREIRHADRVRSPWTVAVVDFSPPGATPQWLATEYVPAPSLTDHVVSHGPLPAPAVAALAAELCAALRTVHDAGLAHRDVKPSNVLLAGQRPLLIDFGIARAAEDSRHTRTGGMIGSPGYMPPEQATAGAAAEPGDLFALAAVLVYAATGRGPFQRPGEDPSAPALLYRVVHEDADLSGVPDVVLPLLRACLAKDPRERPDARAAAALLPGGDAPGHWPGALPGLAAEVAARESMTRAALGAPPAGDLGPSPYGPGAAYPPPSPAGPAPLSVAGPAPTLPAPAAAHPAPQPYSPYGGPPAAGAPGGPGPQRRRTSLALAVAGVVVLGGVVAVVLDQNGGSGGDGDSGGKGTSSSSTRPSSAGALPAAWVGTWVGEGPGSLAQGTEDIKVTLTLTGGARGSTVGRQVSHARTTGTTAEAGCTEELELSQAQGTTMVFRAVTSTPTDPDSDLRCPTGNVYTLSMTGTDHLRLGSGSQAAGAPTTFEKQG